ncbi:MAG: calcium-binding protein, partial [Rhodobacterales bacterium]|nr:calcium-binding protein [Rhodobacterales bacterium]
VVNLNLTTAQNTGHGLDTLLGIEHVTSGNGNDRLTGNALANSLSAGLGNDALNGGAGNDLLTGGIGSDAFVFNTALSAGNIDRITDFSVVDDTIRLENAIFTGLANGVLTAAAFVANATGLAGDASDRIIFETDTGNLFFDADGTGAAARVQFAHLNAGLALTNADFLVI